MENEKMIAFRVPDSLRMAISQRADDELVTVSTWIRQLIMRELKWRKNANKALKSNNQ